VKKVPSLYIIGAFAVSFILYRIISRKQEESNSIEVNNLPSTTPVSGTSQSILDGLNEEDANQLKEELKK
jgi:hypothetical protein|tara:strand:+ start:626 stop:835 length:210 start_codon:yes stop_codon:yes gene_type:complete